jgi:mono/diheme cytochrome c family protein
MRSSRPRRGGLKLLGGLILGIVVSAALGVMALVPAAMTHKDASALELGYSSAAVGRAAQAAGPIPVATPEPPPAGQTPVPTPTPPTDQRVVPNAGRNAYTGLCAECHGAMGDGKGPLGANLFPPATDLTSADVKGRTDTELKAIIQNGLGFTGMPGFGDQLTGDNLSAVVAYVRDLQDGKARTIEIPTPTADLLPLVNAKGAEAQQGGALFYSRGCINCHGPIGDSPDELALTDISQLRQSLRNGQPGMPIFNSARLTDGQIDLIQEYLESVPSSEEE